MKIKPKQIKKIIGNPVKTASMVDLVYTTERQLTIKRKRHGRGFMYFENEKKITDSKSLKRFKDLVIPPAWEDVRISPHTNSHLQVVGKDVKGRKQYHYHPDWNKIRNSTKFYRMFSFGNALTLIRKHVAKDLKQTKMTKRKCLALIIRLMEETHIRIGSDYYAEKNKSYGLSTMRDRHIKHFGNKIKFEFTGKKGIKHSITVEDKRLQKLVLQCEEIPGWELFQYYDEEGEHHSIDSGMVNEYIQEISGDTFTSKDFRTWAASKIFLQTLVDFEEADTEKKRKENVIQACAIAAEKLGNTVSVCKKYYLHPVLWEKYLSDGLKLSQKRKKKQNVEIQGLDKIENLMLHLIEDYSFEMELE